jgi:hypothetical protein
MVCIHTYILTYLRLFDTERTKLYVGTYQAPTTHAMPIRIGGEGGIVVKGGEKK